MVDVGDLDSRVSLRRNIRDRVPSPVIAVASEDGVAEDGAPLRDDAKLRAETSEGVAFSRAH